MRSIYCLGVIRALVDTGLAGHVRTIHTASAGCVSGVVLATYLADPQNQTIEGMRDHFLDRLAGKQFINPLRLWNIVDVRFLTETMLDVTGLSAQSLARRGITFEVCMTDARTGAPHYVNVAAGTDNELYRALRATMALPALYSEKVKIDGRRYLDGGISDPLPILRALQHDPAILIMIASVAKSYLGIELEGSIEPVVVRFTPFVLSPNVKRLLLIRNPLGAASEALSERASVAGVRVVRIAPADQNLVGSRLQTDRKRLLELDALGYQDGMQALAAADTTL
jgi:predicted acylesterase/phospholipase RssA